MSRSTSNQPIPPAGESPNRDASQGPQINNEDEYIPGTIDAYRILQVLGRGGMGRVYLGVDSFGNRVAIKAFDPLVWPSASDRKRFVREARALSVLQHPNICRIYGVKTVRGTPHIIMEHVPGVNLDSLLKADIDFSSITGKTAKDATQSDISRLVEAVEMAETTARGSGAKSTGGRDTPMQILPLQQALAIAIKLCHAVQYAHERGIMHRDIKPSNVILRRDGEPILLDFGVAKMVNEPGDENLTVTGEFFGTLETMAPEQAQSSGEIDERADVYSLGAILYRLLTGRKHFVACGHVLRDIEKLQYFDPVAPRSYNKLIDRDLQAIVLKTLNPDPARRYRSALLLGEDLERYQRGQPITARRFTLFSRTCKLVRRHTVPFVLSSLLVGLTLCFAGYFLYNYLSHWGKWVQVYECDFTGGKFRMEDLQFVGRDLQPARNWVIDSSGLVARRFETMWLRNVKVNGDVRLLVRMSYTRFPDGFEMIINAANDTVSTYYKLPRSYSCQFGGYNATMDFVSLNRTPGVSVVENPVASLAELGREYEVMLERVGQDITLYVNGKKQTGQKDYLPLWGPQFGRVGLRTYAADVRIQSIEVYHLSLPKITGPLVAGDVLAIFGHTRDAVRMYLGIADDYEGTRLGEEAMARSCFVAYQGGGDKSAVPIDSLLLAFDTKYPDSRHRRRIRELGVIDLWRERKYDSAMSLLPAVLGEYPESDIALQLKKAGLPDGGSVDSLLLPHLVRTRNLKSLSLSDDGLADLSNLRSLSLIRLDIAGNHITSLDDLASMKLGWLDCSRNAITSLEVLNGMPVTYLNCSENRIEGLSGLSSPRLKTLDAKDNLITSLDGLLTEHLTSLDLSDNRINSLEPLRGKSIVDLRVDANHIRTLEPISGTGLHSLSVSTNLVEDLSPLSDESRLERLSANINAIQNLEPLRGLALRYLHLGHNAIRDIEALRGMPLSTLLIPNNRISNLEPLAGLPLKTLDLRNCPVRDLEPLRGMELRTLFLNGCEVRNLSPLEGMPLDYFQASYTAISSLEHLRQAPLNHLAVPATRIRDLEPLRGMPLQHLEITFNEVETLEPVADAPLRTLHCGFNPGLGAEDLLNFSELQTLGADGLGLQDLQCTQGMTKLQALSIKNNEIGDLEILRERNMSLLLCDSNDIVSLEPLQGMDSLKQLSVSANKIESLNPIRNLDLDLLNCENNPISSLEPFYRRPPRTFYFYSETLTPEELRKAASEWDRDPRTAAHARNARTLALVQENRLSELRETGFRKNGITSVFVPICVTYRQAEAFCEKVRGRLLPMQDRAMHDHLRYHTTEGMYLWVEGSLGNASVHGPLHHEMLPMRYAAKLALRNGEIWHEDKVEYFSHVRRDPFIVVWDDSVHGR